MRKRPNTQLIKSAIFAWALTLALGGCSHVAQQIGVGAGAMPVYERPKYDVPPQVIYRIDDKRYFTIENYEDCSDGGTVRYRDDRNNINTLIGPMGIFPGKFSIEPSEIHIAIPAYGCGNKGCYLGIRFSTDGGKTFDRFSAWHYGYNPNNRPAQTSVLIKQGTIYIAGEGASKPILVRKFSFEPGMHYGNVSQSEEHIDISTVPIIKNKTGQDRFQCDASIRPKNNPVQ